MDLIKTLNSVGKAVFVKYYYVFMNMPSDDCAEMFTEAYTDRSKSNRINCAKAIFNKRREIDALKIILDSPRVDTSVKEKARRIYFAERRKRSGGIL